MEREAVERALQELADLLAEDQKAEPSKRRYPQQALPALHDKRVMKALAERIDSGERVNAVLAFGYNPFTTLNHTLFVLGQDETTDSRIGVLVITDSRSRVVGLVEDFQIPAPGTTVRLPAATQSGSQPFVLRQPSAAEQVLHVGQPAGPAGAVPGYSGYTPIPVPAGGTVPPPQGPIPQPGGGPFPPPGGPIPAPGGGPFPAPGGGPLPAPGGGRVPGTGGGTQNTTECSYSTSYQTLVGYSCKTITGLLVPSCDAWGNDYVADTQTDTETDDSGESAMFGPALGFPW